MMSSSKDGPRQPLTRSRGLFRKFLLASVAVVVTAVLLSSALGLWLAYRDHRRSLIELQQEKAAAGAVAVEQYLDRIEEALVRSARDASPDGQEGLRAQQEEFRRLLFQVDSITEAASLDSSGRERVSVSRVSPDRVDSGLDRSSEPAVRKALASGRGAGDVTFHGGSEPHVPIAVRTGVDRRIVVSDLNLRLVHDVVTSIRVGERGVAYVVDGRGRLVSHPDLALVLAQTDASRLPQVRASMERTQASADGRDFGGHKVLTSHQRIGSLDWAVVVEQPHAEVFEPLWTAALWRAAVLVLGVLLAVLSSIVLTRRMVAPLRVLQDGASRIGEGDLDHRIAISTGDELERLASELNTMAARLQAADRDLRGSRLRLVSAQDEERRRLERNLHDGAQQELVALRVALSLIEQLSESGEDISALVAQAKQDAAEALESLRNLARGIYPPLLSAEGLTTALQAQCRRSPVPVEVESDGLARYPQEVEAAVYFCCLESLQNVSKYAEATQVSLRLAQRDGHLSFIVQDDGRGFDDTTVVAGAGLQNMADRVEALGGEVRVQSTPGVGTIVEGRIPIA